MLGLAWMAGTVALAAAAAGPNARPPAAPADPVAPVNITGTWASTSGPERLVFLPGGYFRTCFANGQRGNAAMGVWKRTAPGRYTVEFTHTAAADCNAPLKPLRQHAASILGQVLIDRGVLALYVSGEFPPDLYRPLAPAASK